MTRTAPRSTAIDSILPGEVVVVSTGGSRRNAPWGELLSTAAIARGARGAVVDGLVRDVRRIQELGFPLFAAGIKPVDSQGRGRVVACNVPVQCGGVLVSPGDLVFADLDGVIAIPAAIVDEVVRLATDKVSRENAQPRGAAEGRVPANRVRQVRRALRTRHDRRRAHARVGAPRAHRATPSSRTRAARAGNPDLEIAVDLDAHWAAMAPVDRAIVLGFRARHVGVLVPNEYVADYVDRHPEKLIGFCSVDPHDADAVEQLEHAVADARAARAQGRADLPERPPVRPAVRAADGGGRDAAGAGADPPGHDVLRERVAGAGQPRAAAAARAAVSRGCGW